MEGPSAETIAELKVKHGEIWLVDFDIGGFIHRKPSQAETDAYLLGLVRQQNAEAAGNLIFSARLWPSVEQLEAQLEEAPAVVVNCAKRVLDTSGGDDETVAAVSALSEIKHLTPEDRAELESRIGQKLEILENAHPRGCLRYCRLPTVGVSIFRRPTRTSFTAFTDSSSTDEIMQACRDLCAECAITDAKALPSLFSNLPAISFNLAYALAGLAGAHYEVKSGKL